MAAIEKLSEYLQAISSQPRLEILQAIGEEEACVCHLEATLGYRQAYISQHLMALRDAGVITARRAGRYVYYRLANLKLLDLIHLTSELLGVSETENVHKQAISSVACPCPKCSSETRTDVSEDNETIKTSILQRNVS